MSDKKRCGLIGEKLGHSFSPAIHGKLADYEYKLYELSPGQLGPFLEKKEFDGLNVTIPYKKTVIPYCDELTEAAKSIGSVNTIVKRPDGTLLGHNTDYDGIMWLLKNAGAQVKGKKAVVLGTGGASLTVQAALRNLGAAQVVVISRSGEDNYENIARHSDAKILINATPVGMYPKTGVSPVDLDVFTALEGVFDVVYNPAKTQLLLEAEKRGIPCANGLGMLVAQAKAACERFTGQPRWSALPGTSCSSACPAAASPPWALPWRKAWAEGLWMWMSALWNWPAAPSRRSLPKTGRRASGRLSTRRCARFPRRAALSSPPAAALSPGRKIWTPCARTP